MADNLDDLVAGMNRVADDDVPPLQVAPAGLIEDRDRQLGNTFTKDAQVMAIRSARTYRGDKLIRTASPHRLLDPARVR